MSTGEAAMSAAAVLGIGAMGGLSLLVIVVAVMSLRRYFHKVR